MTTSSPSSSIPSGGWVTPWTSRMTSRKEPTPRRPVSLAWRVTWLVGVAMLLVFLVFNWISVRSLDLHFAEMDEEELSVISSSVIKALGEMTLEQDEQALRRAVR